MIRGRGVGGGAHLTCSKIHEMSDAAGEVIDAAQREREVKLTTYGRRTGKQRRVTVWIGTDGEHLYIRSGQGMRRQWPQNLMARGEAVVQVGSTSLKVRPRHVTAPDEARAVSALYSKKYGAFVKPSRPGQPLTDGENATFELVPADESS